MGQTPAEVVFKSTPRTKLTILKPDTIPKDVQDHRQTHAPLCKEGEKVLVEAMGDKFRKWVPSRISKVLSSVRYLVWWGHNRNATRIKRSFLPDSEHPVSSQAAHNDMPFWNTKLSQEAKYKIVGKDVTDITKARQATLEGDKGDVLPKQGISDNHPDSGQVEKVDRARRLEGAQPPQMQKHLLKTGL
ncbi:hypothetical protein PR048_010455, partial [Dryococelus australis]